MPALTFTATKEEGGLSNTLVILDAAHVKETQGKRSPEIIINYKNHTRTTRVREYILSRAIVSKVISGIRGSVSCVNLMPEDSYPGTVSSEITERLRRLKQVLTANKGKYKFIYLISFHANASGSGNEFTSPNYYGCVYNEGKQSCAELAQIMRAYAGPMFPRVVTKNLADLNRVSLIKKASCPAVLTENGFYTNFAQAKKFLQPEWQDALAAKYIAAIKHIESKYTTLADNENKLYESPSSANTGIYAQTKREPIVEEVSSPKIYNTNYTADNLVCVPVSTQIGLQSEFSIEDIIKHYYDFSNEDGKNKRGQKALVLKDEIDIAYRNNYLFLYERILPKKKLELWGLDFISQLPEMRNPPTEDFTEGEKRVCQYLHNNIPLGTVFYLERSKLDPEVQEMDSEAYYTHVDLYYNPYYALEVEAHEKELAHLSFNAGEGQTVPKLFPTALVWAMPQARLGYNTPVVKIQQDILSVQFTRTLKVSSSFSIDLKPVKAYFDKDSEAWVKIDGKGFQEQAPLYYYKLLNPGDVVFIKILDEYHTQKEIDEMSQSDKDIDFIGVIDTITRDDRYDAMQSRSSIKVQGRCLMKFYEDDTVFFTPPYSTFTSDECIDTPVDLPFEQDDKIANATEMTFVRDRMLLKNLDLLSLMQTESVWGILNILTEKLKVLPNEYSNPEGKGKVSITDQIMNDFDGDLYYRSYYVQALASMTGSLTQFFKQFAPDTFTEMYADTFPLYSKKYLQQYQSKGDMKWIFPKNFKESQRFHFIVRNAPLDYASFNRLAEFRVPATLLRSVNASRTDREVYTAFQVVPKTIYNQTKGGINVAFPVVIFPTLAKRYGFKLLKKEASYFSCRTGMNDTGESMANRMVFYYAEKDLRRLVQSTLCNAFYESGTIVTAPLRHIRPGCLISFPCGDDTYIAYITSVTQIRDENLAKCSTRITFERGLTSEGHRLATKICSFSYGDTNIEDDDGAKPAGDVEQKQSIESYRDRKVTFRLDIFQKLISQAYGYNKE